MARITKWDEVRECYVIDPDSTQNHIQRLGELEDRDEAKRVEIERNDEVCPTCGHIFKDDYCEFCDECGQRLKWGD